MKRLLFAVLLLVFFVTGLAKPAQAQSTQNFRINSFVADYYVDRTVDKVPTLRVEENIEAQFPEYNQNHGIERSLPLTYKDQPLDLKIQSVTGVDGKPINYKTRESNGNLVLRIGDADKYVHGKQLYTIKYTLKNQITFFGSHDEFYWDVNGTDWRQPFTTVAARIHIPRQIADQLQDRQLCFTGSEGDTESNCQINRQAEDDQTIVYANTRNLAAGENLSFVIAFNAGTFAKDAAALRAKQIKYLATVGLALVLPLLTLIFLVNKWRMYGRDPRGKGTIIPEYTAPKGLNVLTSDVILHESFRNQAVSALIVELAIRKVILIRAVETKKLLRTVTEYEIDMLKPATGLNAEEAKVHAMLFDGSTTVKLNDVNKKAYTKLQDLSKQAPENAYKQGYFVSDPVKTMSRYLGFGVALLIAGFSLSFFVWRISTVLGGLTIGMILSGVITLIMAKKMPARSLKGVHMRDYLLGLREYIALAEADRLKYLQSPEGVKQWGDQSKPENKVKLFEKLLPYAMIFGLEKDWAKEFNDIYTEPPDWYQGNWSTFNAVFLVSSLNSFGAAAMTSYSPPSSSNSSGFGGGGGFSGGGGGGGGGGGW